MDPIKACNEAWKKEFKKQRLKLTTKLPKEVVDFFKDARIVDLSRKDEEVPSLTPNEPSEMGTYRITLKMVKENQTPIALTILIFYNHTRDCQLEDDLTYTAGYINKYGETEGTIHVCCTLEEKLNVTIGENQDDLVLDFFYALNACFVKETDKLVKKRQEEKLNRTRAKYIGLKIIAVNQDKKGQYFLLEDGTKLYQE